MVLVFWEAIEWPTTLTYSSSLAGAVAVIDPAVALTNKGLPFVKVYEDLTNPLNKIPSVGAEPKAIPNKFLVVSSASASARTQVSSIISL